MLLGLGFTFFSGAVEALVDALVYANYTGSLELVLAVVRRWAAMLGGSCGRRIAQATSLGVPFLLRVAVLLAMFAVAWRLMHDLGFGARRAPLRDTKKVLDASIEHGLNNARALGDAGGAILDGVGIYVFYALQPYLLELYGDEDAY